jgi:hypothetical protein
MQYSTSASRTRPSLTPPKPKLDLSIAKDLVVAAGVAGGEVRAMLDDPALDPKSRVLGNASLAILSAVEALLESGLVPLSSGVSYVAGKTNKQAPPPAPARPSPPRRKRAQRRTGKSGKGGGHLRCGSGAGNNGK